MRARNARGFTLPELLVTISIIGTLSTVGVVSYSSARASSRDVKRVSDLKQIQSAMEVFFEYHSYYPGDGRAGTEGMILGTPETLVLSDAGFTSRENARGTIFMETVPRNPDPFGTPYVLRGIHRDGTNCDDAQCDAYALLFTLEKSQGSYLAGAHAVTPEGVAGPEGGFAGAGVTSAGGEILGSQGLQAQLDVAASRATDATVAFADNRTVETATEIAVAPTVAVAATTNALLANVSSLSYLGLFVTQPFAFVGRRRRKKWGTVYNALTRLPEDLVIVRLRHAASGMVIKSTVTDGEGRFSFLAQPGSYRIEASKAGLIFPSAAAADKRQDGEFTDVYHGEVLTVGPEGTLLTPNLPMDPALADEPDEAVLAKDRRRRSSRGIAVVSPLIGLVALLIKPSVFVALLFAAQVVVYLLFRRLAEPPEPKNWGVVYDHGSKRPVPHAVLRVFEAKYNKLLETQVTDGQGRYHFRVGSNVYYVTATKPGYLKTETEHLDLSAAKDATVIASDLPLQSVVPAAKDH